MLKLSVEELLFFKDILHGVHERSAHDETCMLVMILGFLLEIGLHEGESLLIIIRPHQILKFLNDNKIWNIPVCCDLFRKTKHGRNIICIHTPVQRHDLVR